MTRFVHWVELWACIALVVAGWLYWCRAYPDTACTARRCEGGRVIQASLFRGQKKTWHPCRRCGGSGRKDRLLVRLMNWMGWEVKR